MRHRSTVGRAALLASLFLCLDVFPTNAAEYVRIIGNDVNIRTAPSLASVVVGKAEEDEIFEVCGKMVEWFKIVLFSGEERYVSRALAVLVDYSPVFPELMADRQRIFRALKGIERRADAQAGLRYPMTNGYGRPIPGNIPRKIHHEKLLNDRYKLDVMREFDLQPPIYRGLMEEAAREGWRER